MQLMCCQLSQIKVYIFKQIDLQHYKGETLNQMKFEKLELLNV